MARKITMKMIAELAETSIGTVDRALNNRGRINPEMKARILQIADELGYRPDLTARKLRKESLFSMLIVTRREPSSTYYALQTGIMDALDEMCAFGVEGEFVYTDTMTKEETVSVLMRMDITAYSAVLVDVYYPELEAFLDRARKGRKMVITLCNDCKPAGRDAFVGANGYCGGVVAADFLRQFAKNGGPAILTAQPALVQREAYREGFLKTLRDDGISCTDIVCTPEQSLTEILHTMLVPGQAPSGIFLNVSCDGLDIPAETAARIRSCGAPVVVCGVNTLVQELLDSGILAASVYEWPYRQGYNAVVAVVQWIVANAQASGAYDDQLIMPDLVLRHNAAVLPLPRKCVPVCTGDYSED